MQSNSKELRENLFMETVYDTVNENIKPIIAQYDSILNPQTNSLTRQYLAENNLDEAYAKSFATLLLFYKEINKKA